MKRLKKVQKINTNLRYLDMTREYLLELISKLVYRKSEILKKLDTLKLELVCQVSEDKQRLDKNFKIKQEILAREQQELTATYELEVEELVCEERAILDAIDKLQNGGEL